MSESFPKRITQPFSHSFLDKKMWSHCYEIAGQVMRGAVQDPVSGANHYYDIHLNTPRWAKKENFIRQINTVRFHKL